MNEEICMRISPQQIKRIVSCFARGRSQNSNFEESAQTRNSIISSESKDSFSHPPPEFLELLGSLVRMKERGRKNSNADTDNSINNDSCHKSKVNLGTRLSMGSGNSFPLKRNQAIVIKAMTEHFSQIISVMEAEKSYRLVTYF